MKKNLNILLTSCFLSLFLIGCSNSKQSNKGAISSNAAEKVYVAPGEYDEYYGFFSGGFSGQLSVYGLPSGRLFKVIPVFSQDPEKGYGYSEETKPMLMTSHGFVPWDDSHHPDISQTNGELDGRWIFINGNNTPRIARIDLEDFSTAEIIEIPNSAGNHSSSFVTENTEYVVAGTRFSVPIPQRDMPIKDYKGNFKGSLSFIKVDQDSGDMDLAFQIQMPGFNYDLAHPGRGKSHGWFFFTTYNTEEAHSLLEVNSSQNDKDFIAAVNWKKAEEYIKAGKGKKMPAKYAHNKFDNNTHTATSTMKEEVLVLDASELPGLVYLLPTPKSPHGCDVDPSGEYIIGNGKLSANLTVHSFTKMLDAIEKKKFDGEAYGLPILKFDDVLAGVVEQPGLGPLHTEFDGKGNAYTTFFISSEVVKWKLGTWEIIDRKPTYYSVGHLMIPGGNSRKPDGKYMVAMNKITKDRYLPVGPDLNHSAQLYDISGDKMELILDFPTIGEPHYAAAIKADKIKNKSRQIYKLDENKHPAVAKSPKDTKVIRKGNEVHVYMTMIRSHFTPDNIEGVKVGDKVFFHITNLEQDFDVPHGFAMLGANTTELLITPGKTETIVWEPKQVGVWPFYCTDFCSALHQEMQGYVRVSPADSKIELSWSLDDE
ncbi:nitrous-oxide reductase [Myroides odoratimimus]|uniref:Sec-dependent nitrous-oxide reductase n=1 Tax=Myroides odoratimimus TaxID=76832 RepID=UPI00072433CB|nr:Sec-dependent nitrous-oxide reductase [Myroides odoratimimus]MDM1401532.1 Sec-dependent nitrous-oxide reductase [Myroides odoratimimus]MDM1680584.1 Sec-dependent nitrous-oxide reductase [Myroides odoratimimus]MDX4974986.1 Sec-dependent nitrous-oxide reductase [Myroides odoratimimus]STZ48827.1 Nitrous-oxide reductase precursor [Myroides odoratimimus]GAQ13346.1 nitrous-oxide reductase [Myroides odoratimimus]